MHLRPLFAHTQHSVGQNQSNGQHTIAVGRCTIHFCYNLIYYTKATRPKAILPCCSGRRLCFFPWWSGWRFSKESLLKTKGKNRDVVDSAYQESILLVNDYNFSLVNHLVLLCLCNLDKGLLSLPANYRGGHLIHFWPMGILHPLDQIIAFRPVMWPKMCQWLVLELLE